MISFYHILYQMFFNIITLINMWSGGNSGKELVCKCRKLETLVWLLGWDDPMEKSKAIHLCILAWRIPRTEESGGLSMSIGSQRIGHYWKNLAHTYISFVVVVQSPSCVQLFKTPKTATHQASLSLSISQSFPKCMSIASVMPHSHHIL